MDLTFPLKADYIPNRTKRRSGQLMPKVRFIVAHDTGNPSSTARNNVDYYKRSANDMSASAHLFVDDKEAIECVPALTGKPEKAWHVHRQRPLDNQLYGGDANDIAIGVERCWGGKIDDRQSYYNYVELLAYICWKFKLNPLKDIISHGKLDPARRYDPMMSFEQDKYAGSTTMDKLRQDVLNFLNQRSDEDMVKVKVPVYDKAGKLLDTKEGVLVDNRVYLPARDITEYMKGATISWNGPTQTATIRLAE